MIDTDPPAGKDALKSRLTSAERMRNNLKCVQQCVAEAMQNILLSTHIGKDFSQSGPHRGLFSPLQRAGTIVAPALAPQLFNIDPDTNFAALHAVVDSKRILLAGGGTSMQDLTSIDSDDPDTLTPAVLVNADPYTPDVDRSAVAYYKHVALDPTSASFLAELRALGYEKFDEIWGTSSVPHYCTKAGEIERFFSNMYETLDMGGTLRVYPLAFFVEDGITNERRAQQVVELRTGMTTALASLAQRDDIEMSIFYSPPDLNIKRPATLLIRKLG